MLSTFGAIWIKFASVIMSFIMSFGTTFGIFVPANTTAPEDYLDSNIKNVIYLIGDGMGFNHLEKAKNERNIKLKMDNFEYKGESMTRSFTNAVTDSAAGGTALATGVRTTTALSVFILWILSVFSLIRKILPSFALKAVK